MSLRLAAATDCQLFSFWLKDKLQRGINCQGDIFVELQVFALKHRDRAYEVAMELADRTQAVVVVRQGETYVLGVDLPGGTWQNYSPWIQESTQNNGARSALVLN